MSEGKESRSLVLVVDDEELIHSLCERIFTSLGLEVVHADNEPEAMALFERHRERLVFAMLDVVLPEADGVMMAKRLLSLDPGVKLLFSSGYGPGDDLLEMLVPGKVMFVAKPFSKDELLQVVGHLLLPGYF